MFGAAQLIGARPRHADCLCRDIDEAGIGERFDEAALLLFGPAVGARSDRLLIYELGAGEILFWKGIHVSPNATGIIPSFKRALN
jgi:hypothetical protein